MDIRTNVTVIDDGVNCALARKPFGYVRIQKPAIPPDPRRI